MARYRPPEYCIVCGKQLKAQYLDQSNIPVLQRIIGDTFMGYKKCDHKIEQPTPEGEKVEEDYRKSIEGNYVFDSGKWRATYAGDILLIHKRELLTNDNTQTP